MKGIGCLTKDKECPGCGKLIQRRSERCSSCSKLGERHHSWRGGKPQCPGCGKLIKRNSKMCSHCSKLGDKHPRWKGGYENNKFLQKRRRARKKGADGSHTLGEWDLLKKQYGHRCPACGKEEPEIKLTEDHIVPLVKGGSDYIENIQPLCRSCNSRKYTKVIKFT